MLSTWHPPVTHVATHVSRINCHLCREPRHCRAHFAGRTLFWVLGRSRPDLPNAQRDPSIPIKVVGYRLSGGRRGHGEDSIYWDEPRNREAVSLAMLPSKGL